MSGRLENRLALVIGGIGKGIAERFIEEGLLVSFGNCSEPGCGGVQSRSRTCIRLFAISAGE